MLLPCYNLLMYHAAITIRSYYCMYIPYSGKVWRVENLANLTNRLRFAKLKLVVTINMLWLIYSFAKCFSAKRLKRVNLPNIHSAKLYRYIVLKITHMYVRKYIYLKT